MSVLQGILCEAIRKCQVLTVQHPNDLTRTVEPYIVYESTKGKILLHCYQLSGYSERGEPTGWKNLDLNEISSADEQATTFEPRPEYNPYNREMFPVIHCCV